MAGASRSRVVATLRDYLTCEYKAKVYDKSTKVFNKTVIPGHNVKVPQQNNFTDCGLYLLQYVENFFTVSNNILSSFCKLKKKILFPGSNKRLSNSN